jgi:hypothetical protein
MKETDLYLPVKTLLSSMGYHVKGEIGAIDVYAQRDDHVLAVELKTRISLKLIYQAIERQRVADDVYIAIPKAALDLHKAHKKDLKRLLLRLGLGLILVTGDTAVFLYDPTEIDMKRVKSQSKKKRIRLKNEFETRANNRVLGGIRGKRMTAYREKAVMIARVLDLGGPKAVKDIIGASAIMSAQRILYDNHYGWFERIERGVYGLTEKGKVEYNEDYQRLI